VALCGTTLPSWLPAALAFRRIALAFDADSAGDAATAKAASELRAFGCDVERWRPSVKDWNEVLLTHGPETLRRALLADVSRRPGDDAPRSRA
jgi:DNA primase